MEKPRDPNTASLPDLKPSERERRFLHDLTNPLAIAAGLLDATLDEGKENGRLGDDQIRRLEKAMHAVERMKDLITDRRNELRARAADENQLPYVGPTPTQKPE